MGLSGANDFIFYSGKKMTGVCKPSGLVIRTVQHSI